MLFMQKLVKWSKYVIITILLSSCVALGAPDNPDVKRWYEYTFVNGTELYEAYKTITFDIEYYKELTGDIWQSPKETLRLKGGDCEDKMILYSSLIPSDLENVEIVWGFIYTLEGGVYKHVWANLTSKAGDKYVLLNNSRFGWYGIFTELYVQRVLLKTQIILSMSQKEFNEVINYFKNVEEFNKDVYNEVIKLIPDINIHSDQSHEWYNIFEKLKNLDFS